MLIFTEYADTKRYLEKQLRAALTPGREADPMIATFHGGMVDEAREDVKRAFNSDPAKNPLRVLIATDAAREGVNLQNHCADLFHFDVPWNPSRLEQRNGRIDRKLQREDEVRCHYFVYTQRPEDRVLKALVEKTKTIRKQLGSLAPVLERRLEDRLATGFARRDADALAKSIEDEQIDPEKESAAQAELESGRKRDDELKRQIAELQDLLGKSRDWLRLETHDLQQTISCGLELLGAKPLQTNGGPGVFTLPDVATRFESNPSWVHTLDTLRAPRKKGQPDWQWRKENPIRPVVFADQGTLDAPTVHLHLEHRFVQRLLGRFRSQGFVHDDLARACIGITDDPVPRVILLGRLSLYGDGAARLHDEILAVAARWTDASIRSEPLKPYAETTLDKTLDAAREGARLGAAPRAGRRCPTPARVRRGARPRGAEAAPRRAGEDADRRSDGRAAEPRRTQEAADMRAILDAQRARILQTADRREKELRQLGLFNQDEVQAARSRQAVLGATARRAREGAGDRAGTHPRELRREGHALRAGRPRLSLADHRIDGTRSSRTPRASRMARPDPAGRPRRLAAGPGQQRRVRRSPAEHRHRRCGCARCSPRATAQRPMAAHRDRLSDAGARCARVAGRTPRRRSRRPGASRRADGRAAGLRRHAVADLRGARSCGAGRVAGAGLHRAARHRSRSGRRRTTAAGAPRPHARLERLLRETGVPIGLLFNGASLRLVYAPRGESSGHLTFRFDASCADARPADGRRAVRAARRRARHRRQPRAAASARISFARAASTRTRSRPSWPARCWRRCGSCCAASSAPTRNRRALLLAEVLRERPADVYGGLLTTMMRLVFILYAEDRGLMPASEVYQRHYSVSGLFERLREDQARYPDTMDARYGAWAQLLVLFRLIHDGGGHGDLRFPPRHGRLFDPDAYPFLEGRPHESRRQLGEIRSSRRKISDGVVFRVLNNLLMLEGERLSYRTLDVEQIGSVYEAMMGFALQQATGPVHRRRAQAHRRQPRGPARAEAEGPRGVAEGADRAEAHVGRARRRPPRPRTSSARSARRCRATRRTC